MTPFKNDTILVNSSTGQGYTLSSLMICRIYDLIWDHDTFRNREAQRQILLNKIIYICIFSQTGIGGPGVMVSIAE